MTITSELKAEAKRLRSAVAGMFNVKVSVSQSLELIAKSKNYPNWDALSACAIATEPPSNPPSLLPYTRPQINYTDILESDIRSQQIIIHGSTGSGKTRAALRASGILARRLSAAVVLVSPSQEYKSEHFISSADPTLEHKLGLIGYENMVLVLDDVLRLEHGPKYWFDLGRKAKAVIITAHSSILTDLPAECCREAFHQISCSRSVSNSATQIERAETTRTRVRLTIVHGGSAEDRVRERNRRSEQIERSGGLIVLVEEPLSPPLPTLSGGVIPGYTTIPKQRSIRDAVRDALLLDSEWIAINLTNDTECIEAIKRSILTGRNVLCTTELKIDTNTIARQLMGWMKLKIEDLPQLEVFDCTDWTQHTD